MALVEVTKQDHIGIITMNRPEALNALSKAVFADLSTALDEVERDDDIYVVVITGAGRAFIAGADIGEMATMNVEEGLNFSELGNNLLMRVDMFPKPTIAAVNGFALGGGCELAMACDIRIATGRSQFGQPETGLGIIPGAGGTQRLARLGGAGRAKELIFTGRIISADEALRIGLINVITGDTREELMSETEKMARQIMSKGPKASMMAKISINYGLETDIGTGLMLERLAQTIAFSTEDRKEGTAAFLEKRSPRFQGR